MEEGNRRAAALHEEIPLLSFHSMGTSLYDDRRDLFHPSILAPRPRSLIPLVLSLCRRDPAPSPAAGATAAMGNRCWGPGPGPCRCRRGARLWALSLWRPSAPAREGGGIRGGLDEMDGWWAMADGRVRTSQRAAGAPQQTGLSRPPFPRTPGRRYFAIAVCSPAARPWPPACCICRARPGFRCAKELTELPLSLSASLSAEIGEQGTHKL